MIRLTHNVTGTLHFLTFLLSIPLLSMGIWLAAKTNTYCERFLQWPVLCIGILLMLVSLLGFVAACFRIRWMLCIYLILMLMLIILLFCFTVFAFVVTNKGCGVAVSNRGYKEYRLGDYSNWLQNRVTNPNNWRRIRSCIEDAKICKKLAGDSTHEKEEEFNKRKLSPVQAGCCVPPSSCRFDYHRATYWTPRGATNATWNGDCKRWSNDQDKLCYDCDGCRAGVAATVKRNWQKIAVADVAVFVALVLVYSIGCCAVRKSNGEYDRFGRKG